MSEGGDAVMDRSVTEFVHVPATYDAYWRGCWAGETDAERTEALESLSAAIDWCFNPRDDDASQEFILINAVLAAAAYIARQPCWCNSGHRSAEMDGPCDRCAALGRLADVRLDR